LLGALDEGVINREEYQVETILKLNVYLAFADNERGRELMRIFDERMETLVQSGELKPLYEEWGFTYPFDE
jgi:ABC-type amino acid transport substrate-binding protein